MIGLYSLCACGVCVFMLTSHTFGGIRRVLLYSYHCCTHSCTQDASPIPWRHTTGGSPAGFLWHVRFDYTLLRIISDRIISYGRMNSWCARRCVFPIKFVVVVLTRHGDVFISLCCHVAGPSRIHWRRKQGVVHVYLCYDNEPANAQSQRP